MSQVSAHAALPNSTCRAIVRSFDLPVKKASAKPTAAAAIRPRRMEAINVPVPSLNSHGSRGMKAPIENATKLLTAAPDRLAGLARIHTEFLTSVYLEGDFGVGVHGLGHLHGLFLVDATVCIDGGELARLEMWLFRDRDAFAIEFIFDELALGLDGHVLAGRHRCGASEQPGDTSDNHR